VSSTVPGPPASAWPLWPLALLAGLLPLVATVVATTLSMQQGLVPTCNPFWDGCTSISRAARHDLPNHLFRALMLPAATLQAVVWLLTARWLLQCGAVGRGVAWIAPLGVVAGIALVVYGSFLGTEGPMYRWLRQYGTVAYFGFTCLNLLLTGNAMQALVRAGRLRMPRALECAMVTLATTLVLLGLGNAIVAAAFGEPLKGRVENVTEWWGALIFVLGFVALALMWRRERVVLSLSSLLGVSPR
jgi:nicotinamide riboside transporter PnuC